LIDQLSDVALDVEGEFLLELLLDAVWPEQRTCPQFQVVECHANLITRPMAFAMRSQQIGGSRHGVDRRHYKLLVSAANTKPADDETSAMSRRFQRSCLAAPVAGNRLTRGRIW
jgi:hypothetical protein